MIDTLLSVPPLAVYLTVALVIGLESVGLPLPGETLLVGAALLAGQGGISPVALAGTAAVGAAVGDSLGYLLGRRHGDRLLDALSRRAPRHLSEERIEFATRLMQRRGMWAVFGGRFVALLRILSGPLAGTLRMPYRRFAVANVSGAIVWAGVTTTVVVLLGEAAERLLREVAWAGIAAVVVGAVAVFLVLRLRARRASRSPV